MDTNDEGFTETEQTEEKSPEAKTKKVYNSSSVKVELQLGNELIKIPPKSYYDVPEELVIPRASGLVEVK